MDSAQDHFKIKEIVIIVLHLYQFLLRLVRFRSLLFRRRFLGRLRRLLGVVLLIGLALGIIFVVLELGYVTTRFGNKSQKENQREASSEEHCRLRQTIRTPLHCCCCCSRCLCPSRRRTIRDRHLQRTDPWYLRSGHHQFCPPLPCRLLCLF